MFHLIKDLLGFLDHIPWFETNRTILTCIFLFRCEPMRTQKDFRSSIRACLCTDDLCNILPQGNISIYLSINYLSVYLSICIYFSLFINLSIYQQNKLNKKEIMKGQNSQIKCSTDRYNLNYCFLAYL